jgi:hypothetical protein
MQASVPARRSLLPWLAGATVAAGILLTIQLARSSGGLLALPLYDYQAFWAAGQLNAAGVDPYDPALLAAKEREANPAAVDILVMWPAPWALTILAPFTRLSPNSGHLLWQLAQLAILLAAVEVLWRLHGGDPERRWIAWLVTFTFLPTYFLLVTGQFGAVILLGFAGFLFFIRQGRELAAGACLALAAVKPQLTFLFWIALVLWAIEGRHWRVLAGAVLAVAVLLILPLCENPRLPVYYWDAITRRTQTHSHLSPVAGTALRLLFAPHSFWPQFVPLIPGILWLAWYWRKNRTEWNWCERVPALLFASFLAAPYGAWPFDLVVLLVPVLGCAQRMATVPVRVRALAAGCYALIGLATLVQILREVEYFWFLWITPSLAALTFALAWYAEKSLSPQVTENSPAFSAGKAANSRSLPAIPPIDG